MVRMFTRIAMIPTIISKISKARINAPGVLLYLVPLTTISDIVVEFISDLFDYFIIKPVEPKILAFLYKLFSPLLISKLIFSLDNFQFCQIIINCFVYLPILDT
jgi:hypothetical protein